MVKIDLNIPRQMKELTEEIEHQSEAWSCNELKI